MSNIEELNLHDPAKTWKTSHQVMVKFIQGLPDSLWEEKIPGYERKTIAMIGGHLHNARCYWIKETGKPFEIQVPDSVNRYKVSRTELIKALHQSSNSIVKLLDTANESGKKVRGFPDLIHFMSYLVAHEAHHRGQILMVARQLGYDLGNEMTYGIWHWNKIAKDLKP